MLVICYILLLCCVYALVYPPTGDHPIDVLHLEGIVPLDLVVLDLIRCKRTNVEHVVSGPTQVRNDLGSL